MIDKIQIEIKRFLLTQKAKYAIRQMQKHTHDSDCEEFRKWAKIGLGCLKELVDLKLGI